MLLARPPVTGPVSNPNNNQSSYSFHLSDGQYFEFPTPRKSQKTAGTGSGGLTFVQHELMRKRKTPYGAISEQYDLSNIDLNHGLQPNKQRFLSNSPLIAYNGHNNNHSRSRQLQNTYQTSAYTGDQYASRVSSVAGAQQPPAWCFPGGYESTFMSELPPLLPTSSTYVNRSTIPTVMPNFVYATYRPTASAEQQFYGPYWPDGTYSPYRPAPLRDDRFYIRDSWSASDSLRPSNNNLNNLYTAEHNSSHSHPQPRLNINSVNAYPNNTQSLPPHDSTYVGPSFQQRIDNALHPSQSVHSLQNGYPQAAKSPIIPLINNGYDTLRPTKATRYLDHKEYSFRWAYTIYVDLLSRIQQESYLKQQSQATTPSTSQARPRFYPRPPQRAVTFSNSHLTIGQYSGAGRRTTSQSAVCAQFSVPPSHLTNNLAAGAASENTVPQTDEQQQGIPQIGFGQSTTQEFSYVLPDAGTYQTFSRDMQEPAGQTNSDVVTALEVIEGLCEDSYEYWKDGMLLAGCLAYGLQEYHRALSWYQRLLKQEPDHVEAMSNAAAAMLVLGKEQEAVRQWYAVVK
ncbi:hypothetical protein LTR66_017172, partial [Elasticomyces elasticus]